MAITIGAATTTIAALSVGSAVASAAVVDEPLRLSVGSAAQYSDAHGQPLQGVTRRGGSGEEIITGRTEAGVGAQVVIQSALDVDNTTTEVDPVRSSAVAEAQAETDVLPAEEVGTDFTVRDQAVVKEQFTAEDLAFDTTKLKPTFVAGVTPTTVSLAWKPFNGAATHSVKRDGVPVSVRTSEASFSETNLPASHRHEYEIESFDADGMSVGSRTMPVTTLPSSTKRSVGIEGYQTYTTAFMYKTFIPNDKVNTGFFATVGCGLAGKSGWGFKGDDRGYRVPTASAPWSPQDYRTMMFLNVNWDNPAPYDIVTGKDVGATHVLDDKNVVRDTRTASSANMRFNSTYKSGSYAQSVIEHKAGNPFCAAGAITYDATVRLYRSGTIEVIGSRYPVPNHELYGRWSDGAGTETWRTIARLDNQSFDCLTGQCGRQTMNVSKTS